MPDRPVALLARRQRSQLSRRRRAFGEQAAQDARIAARAARHVVVEQGLALTLDHFDTRALQERALDILQFKLDILWAMNDAMATRYGVTA